MIIVTSCNLTAYLLQTGWFELINEYGSFELTQNLSMTLQLSIQGGNNCNL